MLHACHALMCESEAARVGGVKTPLVRTLTYGNGAHAAREPSLDVPTLLRNDERKPRDAPVAQVMSTSVLP